MAGTGFVLKPVNNSLIVFHQERLREACGKKLRLRGGTHGTCLQVPAVRAAAA